MNIYGPVELLTDVRKLAPDERITYHVGNLLLDRSNGPRTARLGVWKLLVVTQAMYRHGVVLLAQVRIREDQYDYLLIRTKLGTIPPLLNVIADKLEEANKPTEYYLWRS